VLPQGGLLKQWVGEAGESKGRSVMGADRSCNITPLRKQADFQQVVVDERTYRIFAGGNANEYGGIYLCSLRPCTAMGTDRLDSV
jgi:hypothetical protein